MRCDVCLGGGGFEASTAQGAWAEVSCCLRALGGSFTRSVASAFTVWEWFCWSVEVLCCESSLKQRRSKVLHGNRNVYTLGHNSQGP